ncbi:MAG: hypothetical protein IKF83_04965 [Clostridia bacterium]|nr:hypothetical protein [Clostridia bacterium]
MEAYYALLMCGGVSLCLSLSALIQGKDLQAIFMLMFAILSALLAIFFKLVEIKKIIEKNDINKYS